MAQLIVKKGATQLDISRLEIEKLTEKAVDKATIWLKYKADVSIGDEIVVYRSDGTTKVFGGTIVSIDKKDLYKAEVMGYGYELNNIWVTKIYENKSPEYIVQDIIDNYTSLTYSSTASSGVTLDKYVANDFIYKIIDDMSQLLDWQVKVDADKKFYFEEKGATDNGVTWTNGTDIKIVTWKEDEVTIVNHVKVKGDYAIYDTEESFTATAGQTEFTLSYKPVGNVRVTKNGTELSGGAPGTGDYDIDSDNKKITLSTPASSGDTINIKYSYQIPIVVENKNDESISRYGERFKKLEKPFLKTFADARKYVKQYISIYKDPFVNCSLVYPDLNFDVDVGEKVTIIDNQRNINRSLVVNKMKYKYPEGVTEIEAGTLDFLVFDWQKEVQDRIKELEKKMSNEELVMVSKLLEATASTSLTATVTKKQRSINNSFILGHNTLGRLRSSILQEPDCSNNGNNGTWYGKTLNDGTISGATWTTGKYGNALSFDGTDDYVEVSNDSSLNMTSGYTVTAWVKSPNWGYSGATNEVIRKDSQYATGISSNGKLGAWVHTGGSWHGNWNIGSTVLDADKWYFVAFVYDGSAIKVYLNGSLDGSYSCSGSIDTSTNPLYIGSSKGTGEFFYGTMDEVRIFNTALTESEIQEEMNSKFPVNPSCVGCWNFNEGEGSTAHDTNPYGTGHRLLGGLFDGTDDYVSVSDGSDIMQRIDDSREMTISLWLKTNKSDVRRILYYGISVDPENSIDVYIYNGKIYLSWEYSSGTNYQISSTSTVNDGNWHHIALIGKDGYSAIYIDGVKDNEDTSAPTFYEKNSDRDLVIGAFDSTPSLYWFDGIIDEVMIFDKALTSEQIAQLYEGKKISPPTSGLVSYWSFDTDASDNWGSNNGTVYGATLVDGHNGKAYSFDGTDDYIEVPDSSSLNITGGFTISMWVYPEVFTANQFNIFVTKREGAGRGYQVSAWGSPDGTYGTLRVGIETTEGWNDLTFSNINTDSWYHLTVVYDRDSGNVILYKNGIAEQQSITPADVVPGNDPLKINRLSYFKGIIDEVRIYNRALSDEEVRALYLSSPILYLAFDNPVLGDMRDSWSVVS